MSFSHIGEVMRPEQEGKEAAIRGWIYRKRGSGGVQFILVRDTSGVIQCAIKKEKVSEAAWEKAGKALIESSVTVKGIVKKDERAPGGYELQADDFDVIDFAEIFPISKDQSIEFLLDVRHLWLRSQKLTNMMKARHFAEKYFLEFFEKEGFWRIAPPVLTKLSCETGCALFELNYFGEKAYLTHSGQLYNEVFITALEKVYIYAPSFRAEPSRTVKHLAEYWHLEMEAAYINNEDNMKFQEEMVSHVCQKMARNHPELLQFFGRNPADLLAVKPPFGRMTYDEALEFLQRKGVKKEWGEDFGAEDEKVLTGHLKKPIFICKLPKKMKAFYMEPDPADSKYVLASDMFAPEGHGEIIGGSERIWKLDVLLQRMREENMDLKDYGWYIDLRKYGSVPHSGFGLGMERFLKWILNLEHIRDAIPFPRVINRVYP